MAQSDNQSKKEEGRQFGNKSNKILKKRNIRHKLYAIIPVIFVLVIMYVMFWDSRKELITQLKEADKRYFLIMTALGILYVVIDSIPYKILVNRLNPSYTLLDSVQISYLGIFLNVTTLGAGIKPGQTYMLSKKGVTPGSAFAILTVPYIYHKFSIVLYATIALLFSHDFIKTTFSESYHYIYSAYGLSALIIAGIILACVCKPIHRILFAPFDKWIKNEESKAYNIKEILKSQLSYLQQESAGILKNVKNALIIVPIYLVKITCWYAMPYVALKAVHADVSVSFTEVIVTAAFMLMIVGVIPVVGGIGPSEFVYILLFSVLYGKVYAGSTMILYRMANYYIPFLIGLVVSLYNLKKIGKDVDTDRSY